MITKTNAVLKDYTSLRAGGPAERLIELQVGDKLLDVLQYEMGQPVYVLGYGTNILVSDKGLPGTTIINTVGEIEKIGPHKYKVDSGVFWDDFIKELVASGSWGLEFASGIPGGTGAALAGCIAAYGHDIANHVLEAEVYNLSDKKKVVLSTKEMGLHYRDSMFKKPENADLVILNVTFQLEPQSTGPLEYESALKVARELNIKPDSLANRRRIILETRQRAGSILTDIKKGPWTAGSFFKNPIASQEQLEHFLQFEENQVTKDLLLKQSKIHNGSELQVPAALVLLAAGFHRGQTWGQVRLHPQHILKIENIGKASASEIYAVVQEIIKTVKDKFDIELEPEVRILGDF